MSADVPVGPPESAVETSTIPVYLDLLRDRNYRYFFISTAASSLGDWIGVLAILALTETVVGGATRATAFAFSGVMIARILPMMILGPVAGVYADRWDRRWTLVMTDVGRGVIMFAIAFSQDFLQLFVASFLVEVLSMLFAPAKEAMLPNLVPRRHLVQANQLTLTVAYGTLPLGGLLFSALVASAGFFPDIAFVQQRPVVIAIWANAATFLLSAPLFYLIDVPSNGRSRSRSELSPSEESLWQDLKEGFVFISTHPRIRALITGVMAAAFAGGTLFALAKLFVTIMGAGDAGFGIIVAATGLGMLVGLATSLTLAGRFGKDRVFGPGIVLGGLFAAVAALMPNVLWASIAAALMGVGAGIAFVVGYTMLQESTDDVVRGRAFAAFHTGVRLAIFAALVIAPAVVGVLGTEPAGVYRIGGVRLTIVASGLVAVFGAVWAWRQLEREVIGPDATGDGENADQRVGMFVTFEGGEGAGKSTQMRLLRAALEREGHDVLLTREPGGTELGERIRELLLDPRAEIDDRAEALLYAAARAQLAADVVRPALERGEIVLSDRYVASSIVYQGAARGLGEEHIDELNRWGTGGLGPDLVILLDIDADEGLRRSRGEPDRVEAEGVRFHRLVNDAFRRLAETDPDRYLVLDARRAVEDLHEEIASYVLGMLGTHDREETEVTT